MSRSFTYNALTLRVKPSGESNREAWFLTAEEGIVRATVFGGPKSRLRAQIAPFHEGKLWIYHDPVRDSRKVNDFDVSSYRPGIRELYERAMAADALAETVLASHGGGGGWAETVKLAGAVLDALDSADAAASSGLAVCFLWRWAAFLGVRPELSACSSCGKEVQPAVHEQPDPAQGGACEGEREGVLWYSARKEAFLCENCLRETRKNSPSPQDADSPLRLGPGARLWLRRIESLDPSSFARVSPDFWSADAPSLQQARTLSQAVLAGVLGRRLATWDGI